MKLSNDKGWELTLDNRHDANLIQSYIDEGNHEAVDSYIESIHGDNYFAEGGLIDPPDYKFIDSDKDPGYVKYREGLSPVADKNAVAFTHNLSTRNNGDVYFENMKNLSPDSNREDRIVDLETANKYFNTAREHKAIWDDETNSLKNKPYSYLAVPGKESIEWYPMYKKDTEKYFIKGTPEYDIAKRQEAAGVNVDGINDIIPEIRTDLDNFRSNNKYGFYVTKDEDFGNGAASGYNLYAPDGSKQNISSSKANEYERFNSDGSKYSKKD